MRRRSAYHCHDQPKPLEQINQLAFMRGLRTTEQVRRLNSIDLLLLTKRIKLPSSKALARQILILPKDPNLPANRLCRALVVTSDANNANTSGLAVGDGVTDFWSGRVQHADEGHECEVLLEAGVVEGALGVVVAGINILNVSVREGEVTESVGAVAESLSLDGFLHLCGERDDGAVDEDFGAAVENRLGCAFDVQCARSVGSDKDGHPLTIASELESEKPGNDALVVIANGGSACGGVHAGE